LFTYLSKLVSANRRQRSAEPGRQGDKFKA
jgi:hypothetical protein